MNECCGTCKYGSYDKMQGYVCVNGESEYVADFVDYASCLEVHGLWEESTMKNKKYIAKSILWFLLWLYVGTLQRDAVQILKITKDFDIVCFVIFVATMNFLSICYCLKNINTYFWEKIMEDKKND